MKKTIISLLAVIGLLFTACGGDAPSAEDQAAEVEADRLDSLTQVVDQQVDQIEKEAADLDASLDELDALFPEENQ